LLTERSNARRNQDSFLPFSSLTHCSFFCSFAFY